jgi:hypothetical protein
MKESTGPRTKQATLAQKRALIRSLIEQTGWGEDGAPASVNADHESAIVYLTRVAARHHRRTAPAPEPSNIIPFPGDFKTPAADERQS